MREHWFCLKDCLHQLVHQPTRTTTNGDNGSEERTRPFAAIFEHLQTTANLLSLPYKEEVAGSNPASPTTFFLQITVFYGRQERIGRGYPGLFAATRAESRRQELYSSTSQRFFTLLQQPPSGRADSIRPCQPLG